MSANLEEEVAAEVSVEAESNLAHSREAGKVGRARRTEESHEEVLPQNRHQNLVVLEGCKT